MTGNFILASVGAMTFDLICNLITLNAVTEVDYSTVVNVVKEHCNLKPSQIMELYIFHSCTCKSSESIATFTAEIRQLMEHCEFKDNLNDQLQVSDSLSSSCRVSLGLMPYCAWVCVAG